MFEQLLDDFETAWRQGSRPELRRWLEKVPAHQQAWLLFELLTIEVFYRRRHAESIEPGQYLVEWPEFRAVIARVFADAGLAVPPPLLTETGDENSTPALFSQGVDLALAGHQGTTPPGSAPVAVPHLAPGVMVGPYRLIKPLGIGGMGQVWLAEQTEPVKRQVALKLIKPELNSQEVLARFAAERQALALMDHPNVARILDAGTTDAGTTDAGTTNAGQPFLAMEFVDGLPLTKYCDQKQLTIHQRLELFALVCHGVQHAHQKGIIHRDLKPNNILVAEVDNRPIPKVIDFGLAKALAEQQPLTDHSQFTQIGQILGTVKYMSPEQAQFGSVAIDTRTDVYALGVILYELLTGTTPWEESAIRGQAIHQAIQFLREQEPLKPSSKLNTSTQATLSTITNQRRTDTSRLRSILRGELDWIVMKALDKDRDRRYESAAAFADDVRRCLGGHPVVARPPSWWYRTRKFLRRNPLRTATVALAILAAIVIGIQSYQVSSANELLRRQQITSAFVEMVNRRVDGQRGWTWKNQAAISAAAGPGAEIIGPADWRSELLSAHMALDLDYRETLLPNESVFDMKFHPQRQNELFAIDLKGTVGRPRYVRKLQLQPVGAIEEVYSYAPSWRFELSHLGKQDGGRSLAFHPTGDLVAWGTRAGDVIVRRYDRLNEDLVRINAGSSDSRSVNFSSNGRYLFALNEPKLQRYDGENGFVLDREYDVEPGLNFKINPRDETIRVVGGTEYNLELQPTTAHAFINGHYNPTYSPDGFYLAASDNFHRIGMHGLDKAETLRVLGEAKEAVNIDFSHDSRMLCVATEEQVKLWDLYDGRQLLDVKLSRGGRIKGAFSPDNQTLLLSKPKGIDRYALQRSDLFRVCGIGPQPVHSFQQIGDGLLVVYHSFEVRQITVAYWDLNSGRLRNYIVLRPDELTWVLPVLVDAERNQAVVGWLTPQESAVCVLDLQRPDWQTSPRQVFLIPGILRWAALQDRQALVSRNRNQWQWRGWQGQPDRMVLDVSLQDMIRGSDKVTVTESHGSRMFVGTEAGNWYCFESSDGQRVAEGRVGAEIAVSALAVSPSGEELAVGTVNGSVTLTSVRQPKQTRVWQVGEGEVSALAWVDAQTLITANRASPVVVWSMAAESPQQYATLLRSDRPVVRMRYCPQRASLLIQQEGRYGVGMIAWQQLRDIISAAGLE